MWAKGVGEKKWEKRFTNVIKEAVKSDNETKKII